MEKYVFLVLSALFSPSVTLPPSITKQYRTDYTYNRKTDAFYKLHTELEAGWRANSICVVEGTQLMVASSHEDLIQAHAMLKQFPDIANYVWIGSDGQEHESAEEQPIIDLNSLGKISTPSYEWVKNCNTMNRNGDINFASCYRRLPFICKVDTKDAPYDGLCGVYGTNYTYEASVGSCYKIPYTPRTWNQAYAECRHEGAHLVVINSEAEHLVIKRLLMLASLKPHFLHLGDIIAGLRTEKTNSTSRVFKTIFNQTLEEAGFDQWSPEPNYLWGQEYCGSIHPPDGKYRIISCTLYYLFICEKEVIL